MSISIGIPRETAPGERRVALVPEIVARLVKQETEVLVERGAGAGAFYPDARYEEAGARVVDRQEAFQADVVLKVQPPTSDEIEALRKGSVFISFLRPLDEPRTAAGLAKQGVTALSLELVPRTTRAQKMDALSAMSSIGGYKAALLAADRLPKFFPLLTTAAGTLRPAKVFVLGAGVAGLQAIATARRIGAVVSAYDVREAAAEQVESIGATFVRLQLDTGDAEDRGGYAKALAEEQQRRQVELLVPHVGASDVVISTALIPGRPAPLLISEEAVNAMVPGSVIIDMAAENGGNCALTVAGEVVRHNEVEIHGPVNFPSEMPVHASQMLARTLVAMITEFIKDGAWVSDFEDDIFKGACVTHGGEIVNERVKSLAAA